MNKQLLLNLNFWENAADLWLGNKKLQKAFSVAEFIEKDLPNGGGIQELIKTFQEEVVKLSKSSDIE